MTNSKIKGPGLSSPSFADLGLSEKTLKALKDRNFLVPTPIQAKVIPVILEEELDVIGKAQTGTGKTAAFGLPLIEFLQDKGNSKESNGLPQALILVPTRELAEQVAQEIGSFCGGRKIRITAIYGGQSIFLQLKSLKQGVDIVVGTPGRIMDHLERKSLNLSKIKYFILDEADEMLNMGFMEDVEEILKSVTGPKRVFLFSATMPPRILNLVKKYMGKHKLVEAVADGTTTHLVDQSYIKVSYSDKFDALCRFIDGQKNFYGLVFCRTKFEVDEVERKLEERGYLSEAIHGDCTQAHREKILAQFKSKKTNILVATDVAARGIDIKDLGFVINYSIPQFPDSYVHRIGRTGRSGKEGKALTFVTPDESRGFSSLMRFLKTDIRLDKLPKVEEIIKNQKSSIKEQLFNMPVQPGAEYLKLAVELLKQAGPEEDEKEKLSPEKVLATLLEYTFKDKLNPKKYREIQQDQPGRSSGRYEEYRNKDRDYRSRPFFPNKGPKRTRPSLFR